MTDDAKISALSIYCISIAIRCAARLNLQTIPGQALPMSGLVFKIVPPSAQLLVPVATTRMNRPLPFRPSQSHDRNGNSSLKLSCTTDHSAQRTNGSSTKASKRDDIVEARLLSESEIISDHTPPKGIIISSYIYGSR